MTANLNLGSNAVGSGRNDKNQPTSLTVGFESWLILSNRATYNIGLKGRMQQLSESLCLPWKVTNSLAAVFCCGTRPPHDVAIDSLTGTCWVEMLSAFSLSQWDVHGGTRVYMPYSPLRACRVIHIFHPLKKA